MDTLAIKTFVAVAESKSFSRAAEMLFLTQPAVSKRIAALEEELECRLFDRIGRKTQLTEAGAKLYPRTKRILLELDDSRREIRNLADTISGPLHMATSHHVGLHRLPPVLRRYLKTHPNVELDIQFLDSETACMAVAKGEVELAVITLPNRAANNLQLTRIWVDPLCVVVPKDHPLADVPQPVPPAILAKFPTILPGPNTFTRELIDSEFIRHGIRPNVRFSINYLETIRMLVGVGMGWSVLPESMSHSDELAVLQINGIKLQRHLGIVRHAERTLSNAARILINFTLDHQVPDN